MLGHSISRERLIGWRFGQDIICIFFFGPFSGLPILFRHVLGLSHFSALRSACIIMFTAVFKTSIHVRKQLSASAMSLTMHAHRTRFASVTLTRLDVYDRSSMCQNLSETN